MNNTIASVIGVNKYQYEIMVLDNYLLWCNLNAYDDSEVQLYMINKGLFKWWLFEYTALEDEFLEDIKPYRTVTAHVELRKLYISKTIKIGKYSPKELLHEIRKKQKKGIAAKAYSGGITSLN